MKHLIANEVNAVDEVNRLQQQLAQLKLVEFENNRAIAVNKRKIFLINTIAELTNELNSLCTN